MQWFLKVLKEYANFEGRARRTEYWMFFLFYVIGLVVLYVIDLVLLSQVGIGGLSFLYSLALLVPSLAVGARRLHDTGKSGWWQLISFVPLVGGIILIVFLATDGEPTPNQWGVNPKMNGYPGAYPGQQAPGAYGQAGGYQQGPLV